MNQEQILKCIFEVVDEFNEPRPKKEWISKELSTKLMGDVGSLDSLGLVRFIISLEQKLEENLGNSIILADEKAMSLESSPFLTIGSLAKYIQQKVEL